MRAAVTCLILASGLLPSPRLCVSGAQVGRPLQHYSRALLQGTGSSGQRAAGVTQDIASAGTGPSPAEAAGLRQPALQNTTAGLGDSAGLQSSPRAVDTEAAEGAGPQTPTAVDEAALNETPATPETQPSNDNIAKPIPALASSPAEAAQENGASLSSVSVPPSPAAQTLVSQAAAPKPGSAGSMLAPQSSADEAVELGRGAAAAAAPKAASVKPAEPTIEASEAMVPAASPAVSQNLQSAAASPKPAPSRPSQSASSTPRAGAGAAGAGAGTSTNQAIRNDFATDAAAPAPLVQQVPASIVAALGAGGEILKGDDAAALSPEGMSYGASDIDPGTPAPIIHQTG